MKEDGHEYETISSFLIECLVWNVPNGYFGNAKLSEDVEASLDYLIYNTSNPDLCGKWERFLNFYIFSILAENTLVLK